MHDQDLSAALAADVDGSFEQLVLTFQDRLYAFALRLTGSPQDAEEVTQDAFVRAYRALVSYPDSRIRSLALRPWLHQIVLNIFRFPTCWNARRIAARHRVPFSSAREATAAGYRPCRGCRPALAS